MREKRYEGVLFVRMRGALKERFEACVEKDRELWGGESTTGTVVRALIQEYCERVESAHASDVAREAATVMRRGVRR